MNQTPKTRATAHSQIESADRELSALQEERAALPKNDCSLAARRLDLEIEEGHARIARLNDELAQPATAHTKLPWRVVTLHPNSILGAGQRGDESFRIEPDPYTVRMNRDCAMALVEANAALIVHRVNSFDGLLAACEFLACKVQILSGRGGDLTEDDVEQYEKACAAIAKAREVKP